MKPASPFPTRLQNRFGMQVTDGDYWPRAGALEAAENLLRGNSISLFGLRRIGKSSYMAAVRSHVGANSGACVVDVDAQRCDGLHALFNAVLTNLPDQTARDRVLSAFHSNLPVAETIVRKARSLLSGKAEPFTQRDEGDLIAYWEHLAAPIAERLAATGRPFTLFVDELPMLCEKMVKRPHGVENVNTLLAGLRAWRAMPRVGMFVTGSVGLRGLAKQYGISANHLNDTIVLTLPPLDATEVPAMLRALVAGAGAEPWNADVEQAVLVRLASAYPGVIQYAFSQLRGARVTTADDVERVFRNQIRPGIERNFFLQFRERMNRYDKALRRLLDQALRLVAAAPANAGIAEAVFYKAFKPAAEAEDAIEILCEEGFLHFDTETRVIGFADGLAVAWWKGRPNGHA